MGDSRSKWPESNKGSASERGPMSRRKGFAAARRTGSSHRIAAEPIALRIGGGEELHSHSWLDASSASLAEKQASNGTVGPYQLVCELASGGMATVYLAVKAGIGGFEKLVAIKRIHSNLAHIPDFAKMFMDEARLTAMIAHPHVCAAMDFGKEGDDLFIAMEFLKGESLGRVAIRHSQNLELANEPARVHVLARVFAGLAEGIHAIHSLKDEEGRELGVIHRDLTPQNLFVLFDGTVRVTDLGIAYAREKLHQTADGAVKGKLSYMAPEQLERQPSDCRSDIWSLGVVMWEILTGYRLFRRGSEAETAIAVVQRAVPLPSTLNSHIPKRLDEIVLKALHRDLSQRYQSMAELAQDLESFLSGSGVTVTNMDVAQWMSKVFPDGAEKTNRLIGRARQIVAHLSGHDELETHVDTDSLGSLVQLAAPPSRPPSPSQTEILTHIPIHDVDADTPSEPIRHLRNTPTVRRAAYRPRGSVSALTIAAVLGIVLGFIIAWNLRPSNNKGPAVDTTSAVEKP